MRDDRALCVLYSSKYVCIYFIHVASAAGSSGARWSHKKTNPPPSHRDEECTRARVYTNRLRQAFDAGRRAA